MKPGFKTTEFYVTIVCQFIGMLATTGVLTPEGAEMWTQVAIQAGGLATMVLSAAGYTTSRGKAKQGGAQ